MSEGKNKTTEYQTGTSTLPREIDIDLEKKDAEVIPVPTPDFYAWMIECQNLAIPTARSYSSAINTLDTFCREKHVGSGRLKSADSVNELEVNIRLLTSDEEFQINNASQHNRLTAALKKYADFLGVHGDTFREICAMRHNATSRDPEEILRVRATLAEPRFEYGFKNDSVEISRFRDSYSEVNGVSCTLSDDQLIQVIKSIGFVFDGKVYIIRDEEIKHIEEDLENDRAQGISIIYYSKLYEANFGEYDSEKIISPDMLKAVIKESCPQYHFRSNYFAFKDGKTTEIELIHDDIMRVWGNSLFQSFVDLSVKLPLIPYDKIRAALAQNGDFVWSSHETYVRRSQIHIPDEDLNQVVDCIEESIRINGRAMFDDLPLSDIEELNPQISETALCNVIYKLVEDRYDRNDRVLTRKGESKDIYTAVVEYCRNVDKCTYSRLEAIAKKVAGVIRQPAIVDAANNVMVRIDKEHFVADKFIEFDVSQIDNALDQTVNGSFIGLKEITTFVNFPFCGYRWNLYLLESYCRRFSERYIYKTRRANSSNSGAVVRKGCQLSYHDIMAHAVAQARVTLDEPDVFDYLTQTGYMERKRYSDIDSLISEAFDLRSQEG